MTLKQLATKLDECEARGFDVASMQASDLFNPSIPREVRDVLRFDLTRRWSERRAVELAGR